VDSTSELSILPMQLEDIPAVLELEAGILSAWSRKQLESELEQPTGFQFVARRPGSESILAFLCGRLVADEAEILKLNVADLARRKGLGSRLLDFALDFFKENGAQNCFLELRASNLGAGKLYEKRGFTVAGRRRNYYDQPVEDAVLMQLRL
jgi:[ribosomal protein S18]-alanine N-acetyltransferase